MRVADCERVLEGVCELVTELEAEAVEEGEALLVALGELVGVGDGLRQNSWCSSGGELGGHSVQLAEPGMATEWLLQGGQAVAQAGAGAYLPASHSGQLVYPGLG